MNTILDLLELYLLDGKTRISIDPAQVSTVLEVPMERAIVDGIQPIRPHCLILVHGCQFRLALTYEGYKNAVKEYCEELEMEAKAEEATLQ
jgi:hypothetical protein